MQRFTSSIKASLDSHNWFGALFLALALPDICAGLEAPERPVGDRYKDWFQRYLRPSYHPQSMHELMQVSAPQALVGMPASSLERMKLQPAPEDAAFTAEDCYRLRCKCLHQGLPERMSQERVHFTVPDLTGRFHIHRNSIDGVLQLSIDEFCRDVADAALRWWHDVQNTPEIVGRGQHLIKIYGLDAAELPIVKYAGQ